MKVKRLYYYYPLCSTHLLSWGVLDALPKGPIPAAK
jgi:hypothetical protein